jgi:hypothetical protein
MPKHPVHERKYCDTILSTKQSSRSSTRCRVAGTGADESILVTMEMLLPVHYHDDVMSIVRDMFLLILMIVVLDHRDVHPFCWRSGVEPRAWAWWWWL